MCRPRIIGAAAFARATPDVPAEFYECEACGQEVLGDPEGSLCPSCMKEAGEWPPWEGGE